MAGFHRPDSGQLFYNGSNIWSRTFNFRSLVRYLSTDLELLPRFTVDQNLKFFSDLFGLQGTLPKTVLDSIDLDSPVNWLTQNEQLRLKLAIFLMHDRPLAVWAYPLSWLNSFHRELCLTELTKLLETDKLLVSFDTCPLEIADRQVSLEISESSGEASATGRCKR